MITELEKSFDRKAEKNRQRSNQQLKKEALEIAEQWLDLDKVLEKCVVKQDFWCKHGLHKNKHFCRDIGIMERLSVDDMDVCLKCGKIIVYCGGNITIGYLDPNKPFYVEEETKLESK